MTAEANGNADLEHLFKAANDALTDDMVTRIAQTAADGMDLVDQVNRTGLNKALPALAELVQNGDLDRLVRLARVYGSAEDALTDDMISRMAETAAEGMDLLDQANRSGIKRAIPALAQLVENGDLDRLVRVARVYGSAEDALTDDMIGRMAETIGEGLSMLDRLNRSGVGRLIGMLEKMEANGSLERMTETLPRLADRLGQLESLLAALDRAGEASSSQVADTGGFRSLAKMLKDRQNQDALRHLLNIGRALKAST